MLIRHNYTFITSFMCDIVFDKLDLNPCNKNKFFVLSSIIILSTYKNQPEYMQCLICHV